MIDHDKDNEKPTDDNPATETVCEVFTKLVANDPRFIQAKPSGKAFVIGGVKR